MGFSSGRPLGGVEARFHPSVIILLKSPQFLLAGALVAFPGLPTASAHETAYGHHHDEAVAPVPLPFVVEKKGPTSAPKAVKLDPGTKVTGQGFWEGQGQTTSQSISSPKAQRSNGVKHKQLIFVVDRENLGGWRGVYETTFPTGGTTS